MNEKMLLNVNNVSVVIDKKEILHNVNMNVKEHDFIFLTGNTGSGKSTFMNLIARYQPLEIPKYSLRGDILYNGNNSHLNFSIFNAHDAQWYLREICYLKQEVKTSGTILQLFQRALNTINVSVNKLDVWELFESCNVFSSYKNEVSRKSFSRLFEKDFLDRKFESLSGGQKRVIEILIALMRSRHENIKILLIDEPFNHLDVKNIKLAVNLLLKLRQENKKLAIVVSTHCMAFPSPCISSSCTNGIEAEHFQHYIAVDNSIRIANENEEYRQGSCFLDSL